MPFIYRLMLLLYKNTDTFQYMIYAFKLSNDYYVSHVEYAHESIRYANASWGWAIIVLVTGTLSFPDIADDAWKLFQRWSYFTMMVSMLFSLPRQRTFHRFCFA